MHRVRQQLSPLQHACPGIDYGMPIFVLCLAVTLVWGLFPGPMPSGRTAFPWSAIVSTAWATDSSARPGSSDGKALHAQPWAFGTSPHRKDSLWQSGMRGGSLTGRKGEKRPASPPAAQEKTHQSREGLGIQLNREAAHWRDTLPHEFSPDEQAPLGGTRNILRAYGQASSDDFSVKVGPELSIKNHDGIDHMARDSEPDAAVGMGMRFKLDF